MNIIIKVLVFASLILPIMATSEVRLNSGDGSKIKSAKRYCEFKRPLSIVKKTKCLQKVDPDSDNLRSKFDNCPLVRNRSQVDSDNDAVGDACEIIDLAVLSTDNNGSVAIFKDAKNKGKPYGIADVTLDSGFSCARSVGLTPAGRLFVGDTCDYRIHIFNNIMNVAEGQASDFVLDSDNYYHGSSCSFQYPEKIIIFQGDLYVFDNNHNCIQVFRNADTLNENSVADAVIETGFDMHDFAIDAVNNQLFFSKYSNNWRVSEPETGNDTFIYKNISELSGIIHEADLVIDLGGASYLHTYNNRLYGVQSYRGVVALIKDVSNLVEGQAADSYLIGLESGLYRPYGVVEVGETMYINNNYRRTGDVELSNTKDGDPVGTGYLNETLIAFKNVGELVSFQHPDVEISPVTSGREMLEIGGSIFIIDEETDYVGGLLDGYSINNKSELDLKLTTFTSNFTNPYTMAGRVR